MKEKLLARDMPSQTQPRLEDKIRQRTAQVAVIGLGYVGLPLAMEITGAGFSVVGIDVNAESVEFLNGGQSTIGDVSADLVRGAVQAGKFRASTDYSFCEVADVIAICVPTPLTEAQDPDLSYVKAAAEEIGTRLRGDQLVILESTTYPGTTEDVLLPILEANGRKLDQDFYLAFSPERVDPGNTSHTIRNTPKVVGGVGEASTEIAVLFYDQVVEKVVPVSSARTAELTKLLENIFRCVNIALVNELMLLCHHLDIDVWEAIGAASTKPFGFMPFYPGPGLGGHCIPIDPFYLSWKARQYGFHTEFIELAGKTNEYMPHWVVDRVIDALNEQSKAAKGSRVLVLGVAYKRDVADVRESPALKVIELMMERGSEIVYHDPLVSQVSVDGSVFRSEPLTEELLASADCAVILADHSSVDYALVVKAAPRVVDSRNVLRSFTSGNIRRL